MPNRASSSPSSTRSPSCTRRTAQTGRQVSKTETANRQAHAIHQPLQVHNFLQALPPLSGPCQVSSRTTHPGPSEAILSVRCADMSCRFNARLQIKRAQGEAANSHRTLRTVQDARLQGSHVISASLHGIHSCAVSIATTKHPPSRNYRLPRVSRAVANANDQSRGRGQLIGLPSAAIALGPGPSFGLRNAKPRLPEALPFGRGTVEEAVRRAETGDPCYTGVKSLVNGSNLCLANSRVFQPARQNLHIS